MIKTYVLLTGRKRSQRKVLGQQKLIFFLDRGAQGVEWQCRADLKNLQ